MKKKNKPLNVEQMDEKAQKEGKIYKALRNGLALGIGGLIVWLFPNTLVVEATQYASKLCYKHELFSEETLNVIATFLASAPVEALQAYVLGTCIEKPINFIFKKVGQGVKLARYGGKLNKTIEKEEKQEKKRVKKERKKLALQPESVAAEVTLSPLQPQTQVILPVQQPYMQTDNYVLVPQSVVDQLMTQQPVYPQPMQPVYPQPVVEQPIYPQPVQSEAEPTLTLGVHPSMRK